MTFGTAVRTCFRKYATFSGRASRSEFWYFLLFLMIAAILVTVVHGLVFGPTIYPELSVTTQADGQQSREITNTRTYDGGWLSQIFNLLVALPLLAVTWRRLQDTGRKGWLALVPIALFVLSNGFVWATSKEMPLDPAMFPAEMFPEGAVIPETVLMPQYIAVPIVLALAGFLSLVLMAWWLTRPSQPGPNPHGPNPHGPNPSEVNA